jgi:hypothetical protein
VAGTIRNHLRSNVVGYIALFFALGLGSAWAATELEKNEVKSKHVKNDALKSADLKNDKGVSGADVIDNSLTGADVDQSTLTPSGPAGGALIGSYPNPGLANNSVGRDQLQDGAVGSGKLADVTPRTGASRSILAGNPDNDQVNCQDGEQVLSGGVISDSYDIRVATTRQIGNGWFAAVRNEGTSSSWKVQVLCLAP